MTLCKQLSILISALMLIALGIKDVCELYRAKAELQTEAQRLAQNTATALANGLSPYILKEDDPVLHAIAGTAFDSGHYRQIKLTNLYEKTLVDLTSDNTRSSAPEWFAKLSAMPSASAESNVSFGWKYAGTVHVETDPGHLQAKFYQQAKSAFYTLLLTFAASIGLLFGLLRFMLKPLRQISQSALAVADGHFNEVASDAWATELKDIACALNVMSRKLKEVEANLNGKLAMLWQRLQLDDLTGLYNKNTFESDLKQFYLGYSSGYLALIKIDSLSRLVKERGNDTIDAFLKQCAAQLQQTARNFSHEASAYHCYGAKFAILARNISPTQARKLAKCLSVTLNELGHAFHDNDIGHIGVVSIDPMSPLEDILPAAHEAYEQAAIIGPNSYFIRTSEDPAKRVDEWKSLVFDVVDKHAYKIRLIDPMTRFSDHRTLMEEAYIQVFDKNGALLPAGLFVSIAEKYEKIVALDQGVIERVLEYLQGASPTLRIAVNLSTRTIKNSGFREWFADQFKQRAAIAPRLIFSFSAYAVAKDFDAYHEIIKFVRAFGARVMLKRFDGQLLALDNLKTLKPDYVRVSRELSNGLRADAQKATFLQTVKEVGDLLDIEVLAENVQDDSDFKLIEKIGLAGASR